jgi:transcriptional regulator with XRE-family HTH domain/tetratricopeptide (TPR) repeat protein
MLAELLRTLRERAGLSQQDLAERSGLSVGTVRGIEAGRVLKPRPASAQLLVEALGLSETQSVEFFMAASASCRPVHIPAAESSMGAPSQLPRAVAGFTGRTRELQALDRHAASEAESVMICAVSGTAGVGKTALAVHWAHSVANRFPDGQLYVDLRGFDSTRTPVDPDEVLRGFLTALGISGSQMPTDTVALVGFYRSLLAGKRMLVLLDNAKDAAQLRPLLPGTTGCLVLATSRNRLAPLIAAEGAYLLTLDHLSERESYQLLVSRIGRARVDSEPEAAAQVIHLCARLPLALAVTAARATIQPHLSLGDLAKQLAAVTSTLDSLCVGDDAVDVRSVMSWSTQALGPMTARTFRLVGLHPGPDFTAPAVASLVGVPQQVADGLLDELAQVNLITASAVGRYRLHDLLRAHACELANQYDCADQRREAVHRLLDHYLYSGQNAVRTLYPWSTSLLGLDPLQTLVRPQEFGGDREAADWFASEHHGVLEAVMLATSTPELEHYAWRLARTLYAYFMRSAPLAGLIPALRGALRAAERTRDQLGKAHMHHALGHISTELGQYDIAHTELSQSLGLFAELGERTWQGLLHQHLGTLFERQNQPWAALEQSQQALIYLHAEGDRRLLGLALNNLGWRQIGVGEFRRALINCQHACEIYRDVGDRGGESHAWDSLGAAHHGLGDHQNAIRCYRNASSAANEVQSPTAIAEALEHLGDSLALISDHHAACAAWQEAFGILTELNRPQAHLVYKKLTASEGRG